MTDDLIAQAREMQKRMIATTLPGELAAALEAQARRIAELEEELSLSKMCARYETDVAGQAIEEMEKGRARIAAIEAALKPFAYDYGDYSDGMWSDSDYIEVSVGDLRAAREAYIRNEDD